jgi:hypothetical protein
MNVKNKASRSRVWYWLLLLPCIAILCVPFYNAVEPAWFGIPFFYWYQLLCIPFSALVIGLVYKATYNRAADSGQPPPVTPPISEQQL